MLVGSTLSEKTYRHLYEKYHNHYGVSGLMACLHAISGLDPTSVNANCKKKLLEAGSPYCTDQSYTEAVDLGLISKAEFLNPFPGKQFGYGIAQWNSEAKKDDLYEEAKSRGVSIGDLEMQLDFLTQEIEQDYPLVHNALLKARNLSIASEYVMVRYEHCIHVTEKLKEARLKYGQAYYRLYAEEVNNNPTPVRASDDFVSAVEYEMNDKVLVNGKIFGNGNGSGLATEKKNATMYVVGLVNPLRYSNWIGLASTPNGPREGWANPKVVRKTRSTAATIKKEIVATAEPQSKLLMLKGDYSCKGSIYMRNGPGSSSPHMIILPKGHVVTSVKGEYTSWKGSKWMYVEAVYKNVKYIGFCSIDHLDKL